MAIPKTIQALGIKYSIALWVGLTALFVLGNLTREGGAAISVFPSLVSGIYLVFWVVAFQARLAKTWADFTILRGAWATNYLVGPAAIFLAPVVVGYGYAVLGSEASTTIWAGGLMAFVAVWAIGGLAATVVGWLLVLKLRRDRSLQTGS